MNKTRDAVNAIVFSAILLSLAMIMSAPLATIVQAQADEKTQASEAQPESPAPGLKSEDQTSPSTKQPEQPPTELSSVDRANLTSIHDDKKISRDINLEFFKRHELPLFQRLSDKDARQLDSIKAFILRNQVKDLTLNADSGKYGSEAQSKLAQKTVERGAKSQGEALKAAAEVQELQILAIQKAQEQSTDKSFIVFLKTVLDSVKFNLRTYVGALRKTANEAYEPQQLEKTAFDEIMKAEVREKKEVSAPKKQ